MIWTRASVRQYDGRIVPRKIRRVRDLYWFTVQAARGCEEGNDRWGRRAEWISLTPLRLDLTDEAQLRAVRTSAAAGSGGRHGDFPQTHLRRAAEAVRSTKPPRRLSRRSTGLTPVARRRARLYVQFCFPRSKPWSTISGAYTRRIDGCRETGWSDTMTTRTFPRLLLPL